MTKRVNMQSVRISLAVVLVATAAALGMAALASAPAADAQAGAPVVEPARQLSADESPARMYTSPAIAADPDDPSTVAVALANNRDGGCGVRFSLDGGLSWTAFENVMPEDRQFCIQRNLGRALDLEFASDGALHWGLSASSPDTSPPHPNGPIDAIAAQVPSPGGSPQAATVAEGGVRDDYEHRDGQTYEVVEQHKYNSVATDPTDADRVYRAWRWTVRGIDQGAVPGWGLGCPDECAPIRPRVAASTDGGETWDEPVDIAEAAGMDDVFGTDQPEVVVDSGGTVYAFAQESPDRGSEEIPRLLMFTSTDGGESWDGEAIWDGVAEYRQPDVAIDRSDDTIYLAWSQRGDSDENPSTVMVMSSSDGGESWTEPTDITDEETDRGINQYLPGVSVAPNGRVDVAWYDYRNDPFFTGGDPGEMGTHTEERYWDVHYTYSSDGGQSWAPNARITDRQVDGEVGTTFNNQDIRAPIGVASADDMAMFAWADTRAAGPEEDVQDVYFTRARFDDQAAAASAASTGMPGWLWGVLGAAVALLIGGVALFIAVRAGGGTSSRTAAEA